MSDASSPEPGIDLGLTNTQLSWMRSDLSNLRPLLSWARTSVSMIGFGFTIDNIYRGFLEDLAGSGRQDAARNLGLALVASGTFVMVVAIWNYWRINQALVAMDLCLRPCGALDPDRVRDAVVHASCHLRKRSGQGQRQWLMMPP